MPERHIEQAQPVMGINDIAYLMFKHAWKIVISTCLGVSAALWIAMAPALYKSEAKLFVPYVVDRAPADATNEAIATSRTSDAIINSEVEILTSWDLAIQTAQQLGQVDLRDDSDSRGTNADAAQRILKRIDVNAAKGMNIITVSYTGDTPEQATRFLRELLKNYRAKHLEVHRSPKALDLIVQRRDEVRMLLEKTEAELKRIKEGIHILSVPESMSTLTTAVAKGEEDLNNAEAERRAQASRVEALEKLLPSQAAAASKIAGQRTNNESVEQYRTLAQQLSQLRAKESELLLTYPPESRMVKVPRRQIVELETQLRGIEARSPELLLAGPMSDAPNAERLDLISEKARLTALTERSEVLKAQLQELQASRERLLEKAPAIARLERDKELLEANYKNIETSLGKAKDDKAVDWSRVFNIASVQEPSPAIRIADPKKRKLALGLAGGGLASGLGLAFFLEIMLNRTVKRPADLERLVPAPLLLSIPFKATKSSQSGYVQPVEGDSEKALTNKTKSSVPSWAPNHFIRPYSETIRDRILLLPEFRKLRRKPKVIGVTAFSENSGCSTIAGGLAAALSETADPKVLLVDMNASDRDASRFQDQTALAGGPTRQIEKAVSPTTPRFYVASVDANHCRSARIGINQLSKLMPSLEAADYDYIVFDLPPLAETSPSFGLAALMDEVLLVIEAERDDRDVVKRICTRLAESQVNLSLVFNKTRSYGPKWLIGDY